MTFSGRFWVIFFLDWRKNIQLIFFLGLVIAQPTTVNDVFFDSFLKLIGSKVSLVSSIEKRPPANQNRTKYPFKHQLPWISCLLPHFKNHPPIFLERSLLKILDTKLSTLINAVGSVNHNEPRILHGWHCGYRYPWFDRRAWWHYARRNGNENQKHGHFVLIVGISLSEEPNFQTFCTSPYLPSPQKILLQKKGNFNFHIWNLKLRPLP